MTTTTATQTYTTSGSVRGCCGHQHKTIEAAVQCRLRDHRGCAKQGGYSDRYVVNGDGSPLRDDDQEYVFSLCDR